MKRRQIHRANVVVPADGACKITWKTGHHRLVLRQLPCKFGEVSLTSLKVNSEISVKFDWVFQKFFI